MSTPDEAWPKPASAVRNDPNVSLEGAYGRMRAELMDLRSRHGHWLLSSESMQNRIQAMRIALEASAEALREYAAKYGESEHAALIAIDLELSCYSPPSEDKP